jgi:ABC-type molybdate transport system ATPase subunit
LNVFLSTFAREKKKTKIMKRIFEILKIVPLLFRLPFDISNGSKKRASVKLKKLMISARLL